MQRHKLDFRLKVFKAILFVAAAVFLQGCATQFMAMGDWSQPGDLHLNNESLADVKVSVRCGREDAAGTYTDAKIRLCAGLERHLASLGATIVPPSQSGAQLTLWYIERGVIEKHSNGASVAGMLFTVGISPMVKTATSQAEIRVSDSKGAILERQTATITKVRVFGWSAWTALDKKWRERELGQKFFDFVKNRVVSQAIDLKLAKEAP